MSVTIAQGQLQVTDYLHAQRLHGRNRGVKRVLGVTLAIWYVVLIIASGIAAVTDSRWGMTFSILVAVGLVYLLQRFILLPRRSRRIFGQQRSLHAPFRIEFSDRGVASQSETITGNHPWDHYVKWKEDEDYYLLYLSDIMFLIIPKRFLDGPTASHDLQDILQRKLGHAA